MVESDFSRDEDEIAACIMQTQLPYYKGWRYEPQYDQYDHIDHKHFDSVFPGAPINNTLAFKHIFICDMYIVSCICIFSPYMEVWK